MNKSILKELEAGARDYKPRCKPWTAAEDDAVRRFFGRVPITLLASKLGRGLDSVEHRHRRLVLMDKP